jgi:hypothetical protein
MHWISSMRVIAVLVCLHVSAQLCLFVCTCGSEPTCRYMQKKAAMMCLCVWLCIIIGTWYAHHNLGLNHVCSKYTVSTRCVHSLSEV